MRAGAVGKYCFGWICSSSGPKTRMCCLPRLANEETSGTVSHSKKGSLVMEDAFYIPAQKNLVLHIYAPGSSQDSWS